MTSFGSSKTSNSTPVPWLWNGAIAASRLFMRKPACRSLACALSDATISSTFYIGHCRRNDGYRSAPSDAWQPASNRPRALLRKRQSSGPASKTRAKIRKVELRVRFETLGRAGDERFWLPSEEPWRPFFGPFVRPEENHQRASPGFETDSKSDHERPYLKSIVAF